MSIQSKSKDNKIAEGQTLKKDELKIEDSISLLTENIKSLHMSVNGQVHKNLKDLNTICQKTIRAIGEVNESARRSTTKHNK